MAKAKTTASAPKIELPELEFDLGDRQRIDLLFRLTMTKPVSHLMVSNSGGNRGQFNKLGLIGPDGNRTEVPVISAGSFRTLVLRLAGIGNTCRQLGLRFDDSNPVSKATHNLLFSGGFQNAGDSAEYDMGLYPMLEKYFAPLAVVGGCKPSGVFGSTKAQFVSGQLNCSHLVPVCFEAIPEISTRFLPPESALAWRDIRRSQDTLDKLRSPDGFGDVLTDGTPEQVSAYHEALDRHKALVAAALPRIRSQVKPYSALLSDYAFTRRDAARSPAVSDLLLPKTKPSALIEGVDDAPKGKPAKDSSLMIAETEVASAGSQWVGEWRSTGSGLTQTSIGFLTYAILEWGANPVLGGQAARGAGGFPEIEVWYSIDGQPQGEYLRIQGAVQQLSDRAAGDLSKYQSYLDKYRQYLSECGAGIKGFLGSAE